MHARGTQNHDAELDKQTGRRGVLALLVGGVVGLAPFLLGLTVLIDPLLRRKRKQGKFVRITTLDAVPADGVPHRFPVVTGRIDKWSKYPPEPIDAVYVVRNSDSDPPIVFSVICPHLGCAYDFKNSADEFQCPCHTSGFALNGSVKYGPSPRPLDRLDVEIRNGGEVWIDYKKFKVGKAQKMEV